MMGLPAGLIPLGLRLIREIHARLLQTERGANKKLQRLYVLEL